MNNSAMQRLADRADIQDCLARYARGVDRADWDLVRDTYHDDAYDEHSDYRGGVDGLIRWIRQRLGDADNSMHFLGNCLIEFAGPDHAFVETCFVSRRLRAPTPDEAKSLPVGAGLVREAWGRYADRFERRAGRWKVAHRIVVLESSGTSVSLGGLRLPVAPITWGRRDGDDPALRSRDAWFAKLQQQGH